LNGECIIEVKKPRLLGDPNLTDEQRHTLVKDVFANPDENNLNLNLDELIIKYAGENGIPPQIIKSQMQKETYFKPAWRYEPFWDLKIQYGKKADNYFSDDMPFVVTDASMGLGDKPSLHLNEQPSEYIDTPTKISAFVVQYWYDRYVRRHTGEKPDTIVGSKQLTYRWKELYDKIKHDPTMKTNDVNARMQAHNTLLLEIQDKKNRIGKAFDIIAQTRKVTSYGFIQMVYITAADNKFFKETDNRYGLTDITSYVDQLDETQYPEKLNEQIFFMPRYCDFLLKQLNSFFPGRIPSSEWSTTIGKITTIGFESNWKLALQKYNKGEKDYGKNVTLNANNFMPTK
jgi:hypothetical protein